MISIVDLNKQFQLIRSEILAKTEEILTSCSYIHGRYVADFENEFAAVHNADYCSGCSNGTSALFLALASIGIGPGDEVITAPNTFIATAEAISHTGAKPVFVDVDPLTYTLDPDLLENVITARTKAIVPVHLYGNPADMNRIIDVASRHGLAVVEDCAQAHLATYRGEKVGTLGSAGAFSFYPGKNLGACGDAGAVLSNDLALIDKVRKLLNHGRSEKYIHEIIGYNHRMDEIQAGILSVKLKYLRHWTDERIKLAGRYSKLLGEHNAIGIPHVQDGGEHVYHLYVVQLDDRDRVAEVLCSKGIATGIHYPLPLHLQPAYQYLGYKRGDFPVTERLAERVLSLPMFPELTNSEIETVCSLLADATAG